MDNFFPQTQSSSGDKALTLKKINKIWGLERYFILENQPNEVFVKINTIINKDVKLDGTFVFSQKYNNGSIFINLDLDYSTLKNLFSPEIFVLIALVTSRWFNWQRIRFLRSGY